jgi:trimethylamine--corrinoid protein Co-methyltransferase
MNAEWLAAATLAQMSKPGTAQIYNFLPVFADMRDGAYAPGAIEIGMMNAAVCQMARFYNVPAGGYLGLTNAKVADAQAGFEKGMSPLLGALAGVDFIVMGALQDALMSFDFGQAVIDNEIALMIKRVRAGFGFSEESASLAEIKATGPAGMFAANPQTLERMHDATFMPEVADRKLREQWEQEGASTVHQRAMNKALEILSTPNSAALDPAVDARIRAAFEGLVAGESVGGASTWAGPSRPARGASTGGERSLKPPRLSSSGLRDHGIWRSQDPSSTSPVRDLKSDLNTGGLGRLEISNSRIYTGLFEWRTSGRFTFLYEGSDSHLFNPS